MFKKMKSELNQFFNMVAKKDQEGLPDNRLSNPEYLRSQAAETTQIVNPPRQNASK